MIKYIFRTDGDNGSKYYASVEPLKKIAENGHFIECKFGNLQESLILLNSIIGQHVIFMKDNATMTLVHITKYK
jgi:hypothetical protein